MAKPYIFLGEDEEKPFKCRDCGRQFPSEGAFNLHGPCGPGYRKSPRNTPRKKEKEKEAPAGCEHKFRYLRSHVPGESSAIDDGWKKVCIYCEELSI